MKKLGKAKCQEGSRVCSPQENKGEKTSSKEPETNSTREKGYGAQKPHRRKAREADHAVVIAQVGWRGGPCLYSQTPAGCLTGKVDYADGSYV